MQPLPEANDCYCTLDSSWRPFCPIHAVMPDNHEYTMLPPFDPFPVQETIQAHFVVSHDDLYFDPALYAGHQGAVSNNMDMPQSVLFSPASATFHAPGATTSMSSLSAEGWADSAAGDPSHTATSVSIPPHLDPHYNQFTTINSTCVPLEFDPPMNQSTAMISGWNTPAAQRAVGKEQWYSQYGINRDTNGNFKCPYPRCTDTKKRRDQLWEHWKAKHNDDPYRCRFCNSTWTYNGEKGHTCIAERTVCQICDKSVTKHHLTDHQKTRGCKERKDNDIPAKND